MKFQKIQRVRFSVQDRGFENKPQSLSRNAIWNIISTGMSMIMLFFLAPYLIRHIGVDNYGFYLFLTTISGMLGLANLGLGEATLRYVALYASRNDIDGINRVFCATFFVTLISGSIVAVAAGVMAPWIVGYLKLAHLETGVGASLMQLTAVSFWIRFVAGTFISVPQALLRYDIYCIVMIIENILRMSGSVIVVIMGWGLEGLVYLNLFLSLFFFIAAFAVSKRLIKSLEFLRLPNQGALREVFGYGIYALISQLVGIGWQYADRILLGIFVSTDSIAYFAIPQDIALRLLTLIAAAPAAALMPKFAGITDLDRLRKLYMQSTSLFLCLSITVFVPLSVFIKDFLRLWVSPEFAQQSGFIAILFCMSSIIRGAFLPYESLFRGIGKPQYYLAIIALSSLTVVGTGLVLIPRLGLTGAGYAMCITPIWGIASVIFTLYSILKVRSLLLPLKLFMVPGFLGFCCLGIFLWVRNVFKPQMGWFDMILGLIMTFLVTLTILVIYEFTICRKEEGFAFGRRLYSLLPERVISSANLT